MIKVIGISGFARCGKDTFVSIAKNILIKNNYIPIRVAFADELKKEVTRMLDENNFDAKVYTEDSNAKNLIRPLLVWWGCQRRRESVDGMYWVNRVDNEINSNVSSYESHIPQDVNKLVFLVSDVRFLNEVNWIQNKWNGEVIHLKRYIINRICDGGVNVPERTLKEYKVYDPAPNEEEAKNDPLVQELVNYRIEWECKRKMVPEEAIKDEYLNSIVLSSLNQTKYFKLDSSVNGRLS